MRILMVTNSYGSDNVGSAVQRLTRALRRRGHRVAVAAPEAERTHAEADLIPLPAHGLLGRHGGSPLVPDTLQRAVADLRPDIVHAHHPCRLGEVALRLAEHRRVPLVFSHHAPESAGRHHSAELAYGYARLCDGLITANAEAERKLRARGLTATSAVIPNGVELNPSDGNRARMRRHLGLEAEDFLVGHVGGGSGTPRRDFLTTALARFLQVHPRAHVAVAGDDATSAALRERLGPTEACARVHTLGSLPARPLADLYHAMDAFAGPASAADEPLVAAMAAGVPVVAEHGPTTAELLEDGVNGRLLQPGNIRGYAAALAWLARQPAPSRAELGLAAQRAARRFDIEHCADRTLALYGELLQVRAVPRHEPLAQRRQTGARTLLAGFGRAARWAWPGGASLGRGGAR